MFCPPPAPLFALTPTPVPRLSLFNSPDLMALPGVKPLMDFVIGVSQQLSEKLSSCSCLSTAVVVKLPQ